MQLVQNVGNDKSIVNAARVSFGGDSVDSSITPKDAKLIKYLLEHNHGSPFEHNSITFKVVLPIFIARQWMRHRVGTSYNEISGRYVEVKDVVYTPDSFRQQAKSNRQASVDADDSLNQDTAHNIWREGYYNAKQAYDALLELGVTREQARGILPQAMFTEMYFTCNLRSLFHFVHLRDHAGAQWEIQQYAKAMLELVRPLFPVSIEAWEWLQKLDQLKQIAWEDHKEQYLN